MPTYGTKVPCEEHICALPEAIIQKGKASDTNPYSGPRQFFPMFAKLKRNEKETNLLK